MNHKIEGPFPLALRATTDGAELDITAFLIRAVLTQLVTDAADDPTGLAEELAGIGELLRSAVHQGRDSQARAEFDAEMQRLVDRYADGGTVPLYATGLHQMRDALAAIAAPRPVPGQQNRRAS